MNFPKGERPWATYCDKSGKPLFVVTSKEPRDYYYLYEVTDGKPKKLGKARSPVELEQKFDVIEKMR